MAPPTPVLLDTQQVASDAVQAPVVLVRDEVHVGLDAAPSRELAVVGSRGGASVAYGTSRKGLNAGALGVYLWHDSSRPGQGHVINRMERAPTLQVAMGTSAEHTDKVVRAVQILNAALPSDWQIKFDTAEDRPAPAMHPYSSHGNVADEHIIVEFVRHRDWVLPFGISASRNARGISISRRVSGTGRRISARIYVDHTRVATERSLMSVLVHELVHALGRRHPAGSLYSNATIIQTPARGTVGHILHPLDIDSLLAVYDGRLPVGADALYAVRVIAALGPWSNTATHVLGSFSLGGMQDLRFGATLRNGHIAPWVQGTAPGGPLVDSLGGGVWTWRGILAGFTPEAERTSPLRVLGDAALEVDIDAMDGDLDFTNLESWAGSPGAAGTGTVWGDGNLGYTVDIRENTFQQAGAVGDDEGRVTGTFFGARHEGMGGVLVRDDLSAGFGGRR